MTTPGPPSTESALSKLLDELYGRINYERQIKVPKDGFRLNKMRELLDRLGNPQSAYPTTILRKSISGWRSTAPRSRTLSCWTSC